jgi:hypothetical protein
MPKRQLSDLLGGVRLEQSRHKIAAWVDACCRVKPIVFPHSLRA